VNIEIFPDAPEAQLVQVDGYDVIPTIPSGLEELTQTLVRIATRLDEIPFDEIGENVNEAAEGMSEVVNSEAARQSLESLARVLQELEALTRQMNEGMMPAVAASLAHTERVLSSAESLLAPDSPISVELKRLLREMADAARSIRSMAEYLEQNPEALLKGKPEEDE
jgi:paraquat-inducible protein B